jgi:hypothetical protein
MMEIGWTEITASAFSTLSLTGAFAYVLRRSFDKKLELLGEELKAKMEADKTEARLAAEETTRRRAKVYDVQFELLRTMIAASYRLRNAIRDAASADLAQSAVRARELSKIDSYLESIQELIFDAKAVLPNDIVVEFHSVKHDGIYARTDVARLSDTTSAEEVKTARNRLELQYEHVDSSFQRVLQLAAKQLGVQVFDAPTEPR